MHKAAILIPVYYNVFSETDKCSFQQCLNVLGKYPVFLVMPDDLKVENDLICEKVQYVKVPKQWMESIESYNKMLCCVEFYRRFIEFEYLLVYQLDAFVFQDRLQEFCEAGYDYYGAPWLGGIGYGKERLYVGNGGFSLRRTQAVITLLETEVYEGGNEDLFFARSRSDFFRVAPIDIALHFAFEKDVRKCYFMNDKQLPFGCHAWCKWDYSFWRPYIAQAGYQLRDIEETCESTFKHWIGWELSKEVLKGCFNRFDRSNLETVIWGIKAEGFECGYFLHKIGMTKFCYVDNDSRYWGDQLWGKVIISPSQLEGKREGCVIIIAAKSYEKEIEDQIVNQMGNDVITIVYYSAIVRNVESYIQHKFLEKRI